jgi:SAM-dependent methyltransferase
MDETAKRGAGSGAQAHWQGVYERRGPDQVSWYEPSPETSLAWIEEVELPLDAAILDAGGGTSALAGELVRRGYTDVTVADISAAAIGRSKRELGEPGSRIIWVEADLRSDDLERRYDLWHDRAVFHFMVEDADRDRYIAVMRGAIRLGGHLILATFGPEGPTECSGLPVCRYGVDELSKLLGHDFRLIDSALLEHHTPSGSAQQFIFTQFQRRG